MSRSCRKTRRSPRGSQTAALQATTHVCGCSQHVRTRTRARADIARHKAASTYTSTRRTEDVDSRGHECQERRGGPSQRHDERGVVTWTGVDHARVIHCLQTSMAGRTRVVSDKWSGLNAAVQNAAAEGDDDAAVATFLEKGRPAINALVSGCAAVASPRVSHSTLACRMRTMCVPPHTGASKR